MQVRSPKRPHPGRLHEAQHARISRKSRRSLPVPRRPLTQRACAMLPREGLEAKLRPRTSKRASRPILVAHTVKGRTTEPVIGRYELFHPDFLCSVRLHLHEERYVSFARGRTAHAGRLGSAPTPENPCARLQPIHAPSRVLPRAKWSVGRQMHSSNHMHRASAPGSGRLDLSLAGRRASRRT